jgi:hypothetical protein
MVSSSRSGLSVCSWAFSIPKMVSSKEAWAAKVQVYPPFLNINMFWFWNKGSNMEYELLDEKDLHWTLIIPSG